MYKKDVFLIEIGTEDLPAKRAKALCEMFATKIEQQLIRENFSFGKVNLFSTPRRIAVLIDEVEEAQPDKTIERKGPSLAIALDKNNAPTAAGLGFARSCGVDFSALETQRNQESAWLVYRFQQKGKLFVDAAPSLLKEALQSLHGGKTMRWNDFDIEFLRPVHWIVLMYGTEVIPGEVLNLPTTKQTFGHRFHHPEAIFIPDARQYESLLTTQGHVIPDFAKRRSQIVAQIDALCNQQDAQAIFNDALLDEVTGLVEWPTAYLATYAEDFLTLPKEVLVCAIEQHQKCFPLESKAGELKPCFITISNIQSTDPSQVIIGNERVMRARLSDAAFFFYTDKKSSLANRLEELKSITFQVNLGNLFDKTHRLSALSTWIGKQWSIEHAINLSDTRRAGLLAKTDLATEMVHEFPELQGIMGYYYALHDKEPYSIAIAIREHYLPKFAGDSLPSTLAGSALAIADRIDNLVGIFSLRQMPSGDSDPFGLRRAAMGISRILIEQALSLPLDQLIAKSVENYGNLIKNTDFVPLLKLFIIERLRAWYSEKGISADIFNAVISIQNNEPLDIHHRILAVDRFKRLPQAQALTAANKRVSNILEQAAFKFVNQPDPHLFETVAEKNLYQQIKQLQTTDYPISQDYTHHLTKLAALQPWVDQFFDDVMVMVSDHQQRNNRLQLLAQLRALFLQIADISNLQL